MVSLFLSKLSDLKNLHIRCVEVKNQETISNLSKLKFLKVDILVWIVLIFYHIYQIKS
ncbi:hypothetical protein LEP1GSC096_2822 [Leptospira interrogans serovar Hebdomadis str. R499]|nr:hypothetical protein LEP1GSC096_2822 [Leptospira interrogans serovar Hebdomadis str. R499]